MLRFGFFSQSNLWNASSQVTQLASYFEPLIVASVGLASKLHDHHQQQMTILDQTKTLAESALQMLYAAKEGGGNPKVPSQSHCLCTAVTVFILPWFRRSAVMESKISTTRHRESVHSLLCIKDFLFLRSFWRSFSYKPCALSNWAEQSLERLSRFSLLALELIFKI